MLEEYCSAAVWPTARCFRWPTFHYLDQTTRQDQWGREKKNSVGLPKPAFFQSKFKDDQLQNICSTIESCLP